MKRIIGVRFKRLGKIYFFNPKEIKLDEKEDFQLGKVLKLRLLHQI